MELENIISETFIHYLPSTLIVTFLFIEIRTIKCLILMKASYIISMTDGNDAMILQYTSGWLNFVSILPNYSSNTPYYLKYSRVIKRFW